VLAQVLAAAAGLLECLGCNSLAALVESGGLMRLLDVTHTALVGPLVLLLRDVAYSGWALRGQPMGTTRGPTLDAAAAAMCTLLRRDPLLVPAAFSVVPQVLNPTLAPTPTLVKRLAV